MRERMIGVDREWRKLLTVERTPVSRVNRLPEYEAAVADLSSHLVHELLRARDPILASVRYEQVGHVSSGVVPGDSAQGASWPVNMAISFSASVEAMLTCDLDSWAAMISDAADEALSVLMPQFLRGMDEACDRAGTAVDAGGKPFDHDLFLESMERYELDFDEAGKPRMPTIFASPGVLEQIRRLPPWTPDQTARYESIIERKRNQFNARRRVRRLD